MDDATSLPEMLRQTGWLRLSSAMVDFYHQSEGRNVANTIAATGDE
jgi:hypothetical protein